MSVSRIFKFQNKAFIFNTENTHLGGHCRFLTCFRYKGMHLCSGHVRVKRVLISESVYTQNKMQALIPEPYYGHGGDSL